MSTDNDFLNAEGGASAYPTGQEVSITASATLTSATHGGKTLEICMTAEDQMVTLFSAVGISTKQRRVGIKVSPKSERVKIYNAGTSGTDQILELWLEPGAEGTLYANALTAVGEWQWFGRGNIRNMVARRAPVRMDMGGALVAPSASYSNRTRCCFVTGASAFAIACSLNASVSINAIIGTYTADKTITLGATQTVRDTAATMTIPSVAPASGGGLVFVWRDTTNSINEAVGATVDTGARTISLGSVVNVNTTTTLDPTGPAISVVPDYGTANQLWMLHPGTGGGHLTVMSLSGNTLTIDGDNVATGNGGLGMHIFSPAANKCATLSYSSSRNNFGYYQYSAGSVSLQWENNTERGTLSGNETFLGLSPTRYVGQIGSSFAAFKIDQTQLTDLVVSAVSPLNTSSDGEASPITKLFASLAVNEYSALNIDAASFTSALFDFRTLFLTADDSYKDARPKDMYFSHNPGTGPSVFAFNIHPITKDILVAWYGPITSGGNSYMHVNIFEFPRN